MANFFTVFFQAIGSFSINNDFFPVLLLLPILTITASSIIFSFVRGR